MTGLSHRGLNFLLYEAGQWAAAPGRSQSQQKSQREQGLHCPVEYLGVGVLGPSCQAQHQLCSFSVQLTLAASFSVPGSPHMSDGGDRGHQAPGVR